MGADLRNCSTSPLFTLWMKAAKFSEVIQSPSNLYFACLLVKKRTLGVEEVSTPKYSASLSQSPCPSFLDETERINPGLVASQALKASRASASEVQSPMKMKRASLLSLKIFSMASLLKGMTAAKAAVTRSVVRRTNFIVKLFQTTI